VSPEPATELVDQPEGAKKQQADEIFHDKTSKISKCGLLNPTKEKGNDQNDETIEEIAEFDEQFLIIDRLCLLVGVRKSVEIVCEA
jgi:hypothetical protein